MVKLAGRTEADPNTGQLTTSFTETPEVPFASFKVDLFGGPAAALQNALHLRHLHHPQRSDALVGQPAGPHRPTPSRSPQGANGGPCRSSEAEMPNSPGFEAGTETPLAASYSPFLGRLSRDDGEQQLKASTPPCRRA